MIHWVSARHGVEAEVRLYDRLFGVPSPDNAAAREDKDYKAFLNPNSLRTLTGCILEPSLADEPAGALYQFEREGYFCRDAAVNAAGKPIWNRTVTLRDSWAKIEQQGG